MANRYKGVIVTFEGDMREEDAQEVINAIKMIKGVLSVDLSARDHNDLMNRTLIENRLKEKLWDAFNGDKD